MTPRAAYPTVLVTLTLCSIWLAVVHGITYTMKEEATVDSYIGNVSVDSGLKDIVGENDFANLRYSILSGGSQNSQLFKISPTTGVLTVGDRIDREELCPYADTCDLTIEIAAQYESLLRKFNVKIIIEDINDNAPKFPQQSLPPFRLSESTSIDFPLSLDAATDLDGTKHFSVKKYTLIPDGVPFRVVHTVNAVGVPQLSLVVSKQLDREVRSSYSLIVWAFDGGSPPKSGSVAFTVNIQDVNDNAPKFTKDVYTHNISESTPPGTPILTVSATDADEGDNARVLYSISSQQPAKEQQKFNIGNTTGLVSVAQTLTAGVHRVLVEAQDQGTPPKPPTQAVVEVTVLDTDNSPPVLSFDLLSVSDFEPGFVPESAKVSTAVGYLAVSDPDSGINAVVSCTSQNDHFELQALNLNEYKVIIGKPLDREKISHFNIALVCFDGGTPRLTSTATFQMEVVDVNDNPPVFLEKEYTTSVAENNGPSDGLLPVAATDSDAESNANITYRLSGEEDMFQIGTTNGMIKAKIQFDYENTTQYVFNVLAMDQGDPALTATATVTVNVLDINDEAPGFSAPSYVMKVTEKEEPGTFVGNVSASDRDTGAGGQVVFSIIQQPGLVLPFHLTPNDGHLTTTALLDREHRSRYNFYVLATDRGMRPLSASALITVDVLDVNDNAPSFVFTDNNGTGKVFIPVDAEFVVANIRAIDADAGPNSVVSYSVVGGNASHFFRIERSTGAVVTLQDLDQPQVGWYSLLVRATDQGVPPLHTDRNFTLQVRPKSTQGGNLGTGGGEEEEDEEGEQYVIIVVCIVVFTVVVSAAVLVTLCVLRKLDQNKKLKYTAACCPEGSAGPERDNAPPGGLREPTAEVDYHHQQVSAVSSGIESKTNTIGGSFSESGYDPHPRYPHQSTDGGTFSLATQDLMAFPHHRASEVRRSQLQLPLAQGRKTPLQVEVARRADDFHSTSSAETTTGDSGHGSDEDLANHSHDTPLSPATYPYHHLHPHHHHRSSSPRQQEPPPRPLRIGGGGGSLSPFAKATTGSSGSGSGSGDGKRPCHRSPVPESTPRSSNSSRPYFTHGGQFRGSSSNTGSKPPQTNSVRFAPEVTDLDSRGRFVSTDSIRDDESDLNTTTSGSFSVPPEDIYADYRQLDLNYRAGEGSARYLGGSSGGGGSYGNNMVV